MVNGGTRATARDRSSFTVRLSPPLHACEAGHVYSRDDPCGHPRNGALSLKLVRMGDASVPTHRPRLSRLYGDEHASQAPSVEPPQLKCI